MKRYLFVVNFLPTIFTILLLACSIKLITSLNNEFTSEYYELLSNRCTDAAASAMIVGTGSINTDYTTLFEEGEVTVDPDMAVREFGVVLCLADHMVTTEKNIESELLDKVKVLAVAGYDGYYIYEADTDSYDSKGTSTYKLVGTPKMPYTYQDGNKYYALTMATLGKDVEKAHAWELFINGDTVKLTKDVELAVSSNVVRGAINTRIAEEFNYRIKGLYNNGWRNNIFIPNDVGKLHTAQPILGPTCIALMDVANSIQPFGIGGTRLQQSDRVLAFIVNTTEKYWAWESELPSTGTFSSVDFEVFESPTAAAKAGYYMHPAFY